MTIEEIQAAVDALSVRISEEFGGRPSVNLEFNPHQGMRFFLYAAKDVSVLIRGDCLEEMLREANEWIDALPSPDETVTREYLTRVAAAVDYATEHSIAEEYVAPLRGVSCAMTDNLLTKPEANQ